MWGVLNKSTNLRLTLQEKVGVVTLKPKCSSQLYLGKPTAEVVKHKAPNVKSPPFSLIHDFGKQNTRGNISKISANVTCYRHVGSKSTNHSPLA